MDTERDADQSSSETQAVAASASSSKDDHSESQTAEQSGSEAGKANQPAQHDSEPADPTAPEVTSDNLVGTEDKLNNSADISTTAAGSEDTSKNTDRPEHTSSPVGGSEVTSNTASPDDTSSPVAESEDTSENIVSTADLEEEMSSTNDQKTVAASNFSDTIAKSYSTDELHSIKTPRVGPEDLDDKHASNIMGSDAAAKKTSVSALDKSAVLSWQAEKSKTEKAPQENNVGPRNPILEKFATDRVTKKRNSVESDKTTNKGQPNSSKPRTRIEAQWGTDNSKRRGTRESIARMKAGMRDIAIREGLSAGLKIGTFLRNHNTAIVAGTIVSVLAISSFVFFREKSKDNLLAKAKHALDAKEFTEAKEAAESALKEYPQETIFHSYLGQALDHSGNKSDALREITLARSGLQNNLEITAFRAKLLRELGQYQPALAEYNQLIDSQYGDKGLNLENRAAVELMLNQPQNALADMNTALKLQPQNVHFHFYRAQAYGRLADYARAIQDWNVVIEKSPHDAVAYSERAYIEYKNKQIDKALADLAQSLKMKPTSKAYYCRGLIREDLKETASAVADFTSALKHQQPITSSINSNQDMFNPGPDPPHLYWARANVEIAAGEYRQASDDLTKAISKLPDDPNLRLRSAECYEKLGNYSGAYDSYSSAIKLATRQADLYLKRANASIKQHKYDLAKHDLETAINQDPNNVAAYLARGRAYADQKLYDDAFSDFNHVIRLDPSNVEARQQLALVSKIKRSSTIAIQPPAVTYSLPPPNLKGDLLGVGYQSMIKGDLAGAISNFVAAVKKEPNNFEARRYLAHSLARAGQPEEAVRQFGVLSSLSQLDSHDALALAGALEQAGKLMASASVYEKLLRANPNNVEIRLDLARVYAALGETGKLQVICSAGIRLAHSDEQIAQFNQYLHPAQTSTTTDHTQTAAATGPITGTQAATPQAAISTQAPPTQATTSSQSTITIGEQRQTVNQKPVGNNQSINAWEGFKGIQKKQ